MIFRQNFISDLCHKDSQCFLVYIMVDSLCLFKPGFIDCNHDFLITLCEN